MRIDFHGQPVDEPQLRAGFIGCGSHSFRNIYPTFQFAPVRLVATCDLDRRKAEAFAAQFGADQFYTDHQTMLAQADLDAVFIVTGYDQAGRPTYPPLVRDCLAAGKHVWIEKPPAASCAEIEMMKQAAEAAGKQVMVGLKKMFFPANEKARELMTRADFGPVSQVLLRYPQYVPQVAAFQAYLDGDRERRVIGFLDHLCHPAALLVYLLGMPETLYYERSDTGAGLAIFTFASGVIASLALTYATSANGGMEQTVIVSAEGRHITVDNNRRVTLHRLPSLRYGASPSFYAGAPEEVAAVWEPEFSLGQLYNKGLFLLGYYGEVNEFARAILEERPIVKGTLEQAWQVTHIFEAFAQGPGQVIKLT